MKVQMSPGLTSWLPMTERIGTGAWTGTWPATAGLGLNGIKYWTATHTSQTLASKFFYRLAVEVLP